MVVYITVQARHLAVIQGDTMDQQNISFTMERETKNTIRYQEETNGNPPAIGTLYLQKWLLGEMPPVKLQVTVSEAVSTQELPGRQENPGGNAGEIVNQEVVKEVVVISGNDKGTLR